MAELSLEGNPIEAPVLAAITNALQQLSPQQSYLKAFRKGERWPSPAAPGGVTERVTGVLPRLDGKLRRTQSQPNLEGAASPDISERKALSEADIESEGIELPARAETIQEFQEAAGQGLRARGCLKITLELFVCSLFDSTFCILVWSLFGLYLQSASWFFHAAGCFGKDLQILSAFLESSKARRPQRPSTAPARRTDQRVSLSSEDSGLDVIAAIPDMGMEFGFGPPVLHGTYSHTDTPASGDASEATEREHETGRCSSFVLNSLTPYFGYL